MSSDLKVKVVSAIPILEAMLRPAMQTEIEKWLASLGILVAGNMPADDARMKLKAYGSLLNAPRSILTKDTLDKAGRKFKWFPSYSEITEFLDAEKTELENMLYRARSLAKWEPPVRSTADQHLTDIPFEERRARINETLRKNGYTPQEDRGRTDAGPQPIGRTVERIKPIHIQSPETLRRVEEAKRAEMLVLQASNSPHPNTPKAGEGG